MRATELVLRSFVAATTPSQQQFRRSSTSHYNLALSWSSHRRVPRRGASVFCQHLEERRGGTSRRDASCARHQLRRSSRSRRRQCPATRSGQRGEKHHWAAPRMYPPGFGTGRDKLGNCLLFELNFLKSLGHTPDKRRSKKVDTFGGG